MNFGEAIELLKQGKLVTRDGWNGKDMFLFIRPEDKLPMEVVNKAISIPKEVKKYYQHYYYERKSKPSIKVTAYICMKAADNSIVNGWLASQTDILSEDWKEFKV